MTIRLVGLTLLLSGSFAAYGVITLAHLGSLGRLIAAALNFPATAAIFSGVGFALGGPNLATLIRPTAPQRLLSKQGWTLIVFALVAAGLPSALLAGLRIHSGGFAIFFTWMAVLFMLLVSIYPALFAQAAQRQAESAQWAARAKFSIRSEVASLPSAEAGLWPLAASAIYATASDLPWDRLRSETQFEGVAQSLRGSWGVNGRASLLRQLHLLLTAGHRSQYHAFIAYVAPLRAPQLAELEDRIRADFAADSDECREELWRIRAASQDSDGIQSVNFAAWDLCRFLMLCRNGAVVGYLSEEEAIDFMVPACRQLQSEYLGWADLAAQFQAARTFWLGSSSDSAKESKAEMEALLRTLLEAVDSPWNRVRWDCPLPACRWMLTRALYEMSLIEPLNDEARKTADGWVRVLDDVLRTQLAPASGDDSAGRNGVD